MPRATRAVGAVRGAAMKHLALVLLDLDRRRDRILGELHPVLDAKVRALVAELSGRFAPYCGYRSAGDQANALAVGASNARFGESPHNFTPALACDLVLDPRKVNVRPNPVDVEWPDLWDDETSSALAAWEALEHAALALGLERVNVNGRRDRPHVQLPGWRSLIVS